MRTGGPQQNWGGCWRGRQEPPSTQRGAPTAPCPPQPGSGVPPARPCLSFPSRGSHPAPPGALSWGGTGRERWQEVTLLLSPPCPSLWGVPERAPPAGSGGLAVSPPSGWHRGVPLSPNPAPTSRRSLCPHGSRSSVTPSLLSPPWVPPPRLSPFVPVCPRECQAWPRALSCASPVSPAPPTRVPEAAGTSLGGFCSVVRGRAGALPPPPPPPGRCPLPVPLPARSRLPPDRSALLNRCWRLI